MSHSAISRHVRGLESRLGVKLFRNLARGVELTKEGHAYLDSILPALDAIADATEGLADAPQGRVTINSEPLFAERFIIPRLAGFQNAYPDIEVRLEASVLIADVERYEADIAIRYAHRGILDAPGDLLSAALIHPYASPAFLAERVKTPEDLLRVPRFRDRRLNIWNQWFAAAGVAARMPADDGWRMRSHLAYEAGLNGLGVYLGSSECVSHDEAQGRFVRCFDTGIRDGAFFLVYGSRGLRRSAVRQFRSWLLDETQAFRDLPETA